MSICSEVLSVDVLHRERVFSCGRDRTVRLWKVCAAVMGHVPPVGYIMLSISVIVITVRVKGLALPHGTQAT